MNKTSVLPILMVALVVSGCTSTPKKKKTTSSPEQSSKVDPTSGEASTSSPTSQQPSLTSSVSPSLNSTAPSSSSAVVPPTGEFTVTISTSGATFSSLSGFTSYGVEITKNSDPSKDHLTKLQNYFASVCGYSDVITNLECEHMFIQSLVLDNENMTLTIGAGSDAKGSGHLTWTSSLDIVKVEATVRPYFKYYSYVVEGEKVEGWSHDAYANVTLGDQSKTLNIGEGITESDTITYQPSTAVKSFTMGNGSQIPSRIFVEQLKITFNN